MLAASCEVFIVLFCVCEQFAHKQERQHVSGQRGKVQGERETKNVGR